MRQWTNEQAELFELDSVGMPRLKKVAVSADAGSGKTSVLVERVARILSVEKEISERVLCVSFTERSAADLKDRLAHFLRAEVYTIHGFCSRVIREHGALIGLSPLWSLLDGDEGPDLFYSCFQKVYRRQPPEDTDFSSDQWFELCRMFQGHPTAEFDRLQFENEKLRPFVLAVIGEYETSKRKRNALDYNDLEILAVTLLERPEVAELYRKRYRHLFVDEFQDTSEIQCRLVRALNGSENSLFVVGDFKQSIYRFRGADVDVFREFVETLPEKRRLGFNFRSRAEVIDAVNAVCAPVIEEYAPMVSGRKHPPKVGVDQVVTRVVYDPESGSETDALLSTIHDLTKKGVPLNEIVLLLPRIKGKERLLTQLRHAGIGIALGGAAGGLVANADLRALASLWIWACEPWQKLRAAEVVSAFSEGRSDLPAALGRLEVPNINQQTCESLLDWLDRRFSLREKLGFVFLEFKTFVLGQQARGVSPSALARKIGRYLSEGNDAGAMKLLPPPQNVSGALRVMTVHASKGLEFPVVILADLAGRKARAGGAFLKAKTDVFVGSRDENGKLLKSDAFESAVELEKSAQVAENARLLYVALTRAEDVLVLIDEQEDLEKKKKKGSESWADWVRPHFQGLCLPSADIQSGLTSQASSERSTLEALVETPPHYVSARIGVTALTASQKQKPSTRKNAVRQHVDAREAGTLVHSCLEHGDFERFKTLCLENKLPSEPLLSWVSSKEGQVLFGEPSEHCRVVREFAIEWARKTDRGTTEVITGRVDALVLWPKERRAWVIDYKVLFGRRTHEEILAAYRDQLNAYCDAIRALTGFESVEPFVVDVLASTGTVWHCILP